MGLRGKGFKAKLKETAVSVVKSIFPVGSIYNAPGKTIATAALLGATKSGESAEIISVYPEQDRREARPEIFNYQVTGRFKRYYQRKIPAAYVISLPKGIVYGMETNFIITHSARLVSDVSREFGMYGGKPMERSSVVKNVLRLPKATMLKGKIAVISTSGANNFHHWNYDCIPRVHLLKQAGLFGEIDKFVISHKFLPFQKESLRLLGITDDQIINPQAAIVQLYQAELLFVPSLPSILGTVSPWVVNFLRKLYNPSGEKQSLYKRIYLSRKNVKTRKIINNDHFVALLNEFNITEIFPEDYTVSELAKILAGINFIISIHGSGLSNLCFISDSTTVIDILAPYHQDGYYWMITNIRNSKYIGFFGEGDHPADTLDLVKNKIDQDIYLDIKKMQSLLAKIITHHESV